MRSPFCIFWIPDLIIAVTGYEIKIYFYKIANENYTYMQFFQVYNVCDI